tara:strand:- start:27 stop:338 length:312 start_codon:yes stop_codon:yes gene_type:complete
MAFSKSFPRTTEKSSYPIWEEIYLNDEEEKEVEENSRNENLFLMKECINDAKKIISENDLKDYQSDVISMAISLFEKRGSHSIFKKEQRAKEKFDEKYGPDGI